MNYQLLETDIVTRLQARLGPAIDVHVLPETDAAYSRGFSKPSVTVAYAESDFDMPRSTAQVVQDEMQTVQLIIRCTKLRGANALYDIAERSRKALVGFQPTHCRRMSLKSFKMEERQENVWTYSMVFLAPTTIVEEFEEETGPTATEITPSNADTNYN